MCKLHLFLLFTYLYFYVVLYPLPDFLASRSASCFHASFVVKIYWWQIILILVCFIFVFIFEGFFAVIEFYVSRWNSIVFLVSIILAEKSYYSFFKDNLSFIHPLAAFKIIYSHLCTVWLWYAQQCFSLYLFFFWFAELIDCIGLMSL